MSFVESNKSFNLNPNFKKRKHEFIDKLDFIIWKNKIDKIVFSKINKHLDELEDNLYWTWFQYKYNYKEVADIVYNQNYQRWLYDVKYHLLINFNITQISNYNEKNIQKWFNCGIEPLVACKFYKLIL